MLFAPYIQKNKRNYSKIDFTKAKFYKISHGLPTAYLDHNILDLLLKSNGLLVDGKLFNQKFQFTYSDETFEEIKRSNEPNKFLEILTILKARKMVVEVNEGSAIHGHCSICPYKSPFELYKNYFCKDSYSSVIEQIKNSTDNYLYHTLSNDNTYSMNNYLNTHDDILHAIQAVIENELASVKHDLNSSEWEFINSHYRKEFAKVLDESAKVSSDFKTTIKNQGIDLNDSKGLDGVREFESYYSINAKQLNNIKHPNILNKIYKIYCDKENFHAKNIYDFYNITLPIEERMPNQFNNVLNSYYILNIIGYKRDSNFHKKYRRYISSSSDGKHVAVASYCDFLISRDSGLIEKARAIYEFLNISTIALHVNIEDS